MSFWGEVGRPFSPLEPAWSQPGAIWDIEPGPATQHRSKRYAFWVHGRASRRTLRSMTGHIQRHTNEMPPTPSVFYF